MAPRGQLNNNFTDDIAHLYHIERGIQPKCELYTRYWKNSSFRNSELYPSSADSIRSNNVLANNLIIKNQPGAISLSAVNMSMVSLLALEIWARATNRPNFALSTCFLSIRFWSGVAPFGAIAVRLAPIPTIMKIRKTGVGGLPLLPYSTMANLTFVLTMYGFTRNDPQIIITYGIGMIITGYYCVQYLRHCPENASHLPGTAKIHKRISLGIVLFVLSNIIFLGRERAGWIVGRTSVILSCAMYISPLSLIFRVIKEKSARDIPLPFAVVGLINTFSWVVYGFFVKKDLVLWLPCAVGVLSTSAQIFLNALWGKKEKLANEVLTV